jgi:hypothetical protein
VVPVSWEDTRAVRACTVAARTIRQPKPARKLRTKFTIDTVTTAFGLEHAEPATPPTATL